MAGISSFGFGGSNAHVIISEEPKESVAPRVKRPCWLVTLSARTPYSLEGMRVRLLDCLQDSGHELADIAFTLNTGREAFPCRLSWIATSVEDLVTRIRATDPDSMAKCAGKSSSWVPDPAQNEWGEVMQEALKQYQRGALIDWTPLFKGSGCRRLHLPGYVFDTKPYWFEQACELDRYMALNFDCYLAFPMTRACPAASTTSSVIMASSLMRMI
ncbi:ketoacyl-synthetase C-terminal extension domain-containing protein, partial [Haematospirillum sp. H4890]|uniref:CurL C-terminal domain-containing protein n=2 Tax=unclassified Haematospirillum TaxID=2622088 RepID=UPI002AC355E6